MAKRLENPESIVAPFVADLVRIYGDRLGSIVLYGSAVRGDYIPGMSDVNFLVVLAEDSIDDLEASFDTVARWREKGAAVPVFLTSEFIEGALDAFPIEFLDMRGAYRVVHGEDPLEALVFESEPVRLQAERDARGFLIRLRAGFLESRGRAPALHDLVRSSLRAVHALFRAMVWLRTGDSGLPYDSVLRRVCDNFDLRFSVFEELEEIRRGGKRTAADIRRLVDDYLEEMRKLVLELDVLEAPPREDSNVRS